MADTGSILKILLQVKTDVADLQGKLNPALDQTKSKLGEIGDAGKHATSAAGEFVSVLASGLALGAVAAITLALSQLPSLISRANEEIERMNDEMAKQADEIENVLTEWKRLAGLADSLADRVKLSLRIANDLKKASAEYEAWRTKELGAWATFVDEIASYWSAIPGFGSRPIAEAQAAATSASRSNVIREIQEQAAATDKAARADARWKEQQKDLSTGIPEVQARVNGLTVAIAEQDEIISKIASKGEGASETELHNAEAAVIERARLNEQLQESVGHLDKLNREQEKLTQSTGDTAAAHQDIVGFLAEESALLRGIRQANELAQQNPLLFADQKEAADRQSIPVQIAAINAKIQEGKAYIARSALDPATYAQAAQGIQRLEFRAASLGQKLTTLTKPIQASLVSWVNQFGSTIDQVSNLITSTLTIAVNGVSNAITSAIFRTQSWGQAFAQVARSIIGNIIQILVQWIASQTIMLALNAIFGKTAGQASKAEATEAAAAWAPAATSASIASLGAAAGFGAIAYIAALGAGTAAAVGLAGAGGFAEGGFTGGREGRLAGIVHGQEFVFSAPAVRRFGPANLEALHKNLSHGTYAAGGLAGPSATDRGTSSASVARPIINQALFLDMNAVQKWLRNREGDKYIIDLVNSRGGTLWT